VENFFEDLSFVCVLLLFGYVLREAIPLIRKLYLPSSVVAGIAGIIIGPQVLNWVEIPVAISGYGTVLVNIICTAVVWGVVANWGKVKSYLDFICLIQGAYWSQLFYGGLVGLLLSKIWPALPTGWGTELIFSFAAGHGSAIPMGKIYESMGVYGNVEMGTVMSTVGLIIAMVLGMSIVNFGARKGWAKFLRKTGKDGKIELIVAEKGLLPADRRESIGNARIPNASVNNLFFQFALLMALIFAGKLMFQFAGKFIPFINALPSFLHGMVAALIIYPILIKLHLDEYVDIKTVHSINGFCVDIMIVGAIATLDITFIAQFWLPLLIICTIATVAEIVFCFGYAYLTCTDEWFEKACFSFGQSTGVIATGFALYRALDPNGESTLPEVQGVGNGVCGPHTYTIFALIPAMAVNKPGSEVLLGAAMFFGFALLGWFTRGTKKMKLTPIR
jgi:ESS family glutamate:Na+ symporter